MDKVRYDLICMLPFAVIFILAIPLLLDDVLGWFQRESTSRALNGAKRTKKNLLVNRASSNRPQKKKGWLGR